MKVTNEMVQAGYAVLPERLKYVGYDTLRNIFDAMLSAAPTPPSINAQFEVVEGGITGSTDAPVKRVELQDDGSYTVIIDYWPIPPEITPVYKVVENGN